ncbi:peptidoglycan DD-metalloendopeptidase family protein [Nocardioides acrostichi]|uniref:Peptidoglycan DD-metalloendopeptidase family protein n=1 Tax=Nocardioides acrostichi TaxID=2784339 RepID=A0A930V1I3_9ACTN|nr:M23 family metallopeptidase [Nocardioides acrostichi]MBF4162329.1 peptidoglycan DD-metalloendopeptidase family protein [Nocardioides acrostichi]
MRPFPSASRRRLGVAVAAASLALGALAVPLAHADDDLDKQKNQVEKQVQGAQHDLDESSAAYRKAFARTQAARAALDEAKSRLSGVRDRLDDARVRDERLAHRLHLSEQRLATAQQQLHDGQVALAKQRRQVRDRVTELYSGDNPDLSALDSLMSSASLEDLVRRDAADEAILSRSTSAYDDLDAAEAMLSVREKQVSEATDQVAVQRQAAADHLSTVRSLTAQAKSARDDVRSRVQDSYQARQQAFAAKRSDLRSLQSLRKKEAQIKARIAQAARAARGSSVSAKQSGYLLRPVPGPVTSPYGYRIHPIYHYWGLHDGTDFGVACGEPMRASGTGTVISKYYSDVYGNRLYLSLGQVNGKSLVVVYNHAERYVLNVGDHVTRGQTVGYVGSTGWSTGCHLHFTVLVAGNPVDPMNWIA